MKLLTINREITKQGIALELVKGNDYFYFVGEDLDTRESSMVMVPRINDLSLYEWINEARDKSVSRKYGA